ncbi:MAG: hypothetical protein K6A45_07585 [Lachnospiraceae bacterium]|nr:hypothetical protein [Lachnospiraceae bacterium]
MLKKNIARFSAVLVCLILIIVNMAPVFANAGTFDESWFKGIENVYNEVGAFEQITVEYQQTQDGSKSVSVEPFSGAADFNMQQNRLENAFIEVAKFFIEEEPDEDDYSEYPGLKEFYDVAWIFYYLSNTNTGTASLGNYLLDAVSILPFVETDFAADPYLYGCFNKTQHLVNDLNSTPVDSRPVKLKALYDYVKNIPDIFLDDPNTVANVFKGKVRVFSDLIQRDENNFRAYWDGDGDLGKSTVDALETFIKTDYVTINTNEEAVYFWIRDRISWLGKVKAEVNTQMSQVPEGYFNNVVTEKKAGTIEKNLSELVTDVASGLRSILEGNTIRFENIIYGRVQTGSTSNVGITVNNFSFELEKNNMYGIAGSMIYVLLRGIFIIGILCFFAYYLVKESMVVSAQARSKLKENIGFVILSIFLLYAMPNLVDMFIHLRDLVLHAIANGFMDDSVFDSMGSLADHFKAAATASHGLIDSCEYMGMVIITVYLAFVYIGMAAAMTIMFAFFPLFVIFSFRDHKVLNEWVTFALGIITTPLIDAVLFVIPLIATKINVASDLVKLILCMSIIPARGMIRRLLGFSTSTGAELVGLGAIMAGGRAIGAVARTARNTVSNVASGVSNIASDRTNARFFDDLAKEDNGTGNLSGNAASAAGERASAFGDNVAGSPIGSTVAAATGGTGGTGTAATRAGGSRGYQPTKEEQSFLKKHANVNNFESGTFANLDPATKAKMYRERAWRTAAQTMFRTAGGVQGGLAGATLGLGASTFLGTNAAMMMTSGGMEVGSAVGSATGNVAGTGAAAIGRGAVSLASGNKDGIGAAFSYNTGIGSENFEVGDIRAGIIGDTTDATISNIIANDSAFADEIYNNFNGIAGDDSMTAEQMQDALITSYARYADVGAAMQNSDRAQSAASSYIPPDSRLKSMHAMHECLRAGAEARMDLDGSIFFAKPSSMSDTDYKNLEYAFPKIHYGYNAESYYDEKKRAHYTPMDGYIGSGMIQNMKRGDQNGGWGIPGLDDTNIDRVAHVPMPGGRRETSSNKFVGGAVKGGRQYNPGNNSSDVTDPLEQFYKDHPMEKFYRDHPEMRPNVFT